MIWRNVFTILRKELLDTLRDKRALVLMVGMPVILYPALLIVGSQATLIQIDKMRTTPSKVAMTAPDGVIEGWLQDTPLIELSTPEDPREALRINEIDAVIAADPSFKQDLEQGRSAHLEILFDSTEPASQVARERLGEAFQRRADEVLETRLERRDIEHAYVRPLDVESSNVAPPAKTTGAILGAALPILLVMMLALGAFYPAIDLTAGEKERGTFESLLTAPISKLDIVFGKYFAVCLLSIVTGLLNLISMGLTVGLQLSQVIDATGGAAIQLPFEKLLLVLVIIVPLSLFIAAVMMSIAMFARTMKEAEFYLTPFLFVIMFPALISVVPGYKLTSVTQFIPITNVALLFKELMVDAKGWEAVFPVFLSTAVYAMLGLLFAVWVFQREEVVLSEEKGIPLTFRRTRFRPRAAPTPGMSLGFVGLALLLVFYIGSYVQQRDVWTGMLITQWLLFALPVVAILWYVRVDLRNALYLHMPSAGAYAATIIIAAAWLVVVAQLGYWQQKALPVPEEWAKEMERLLGGGEQGVLITLFVLAMSPAICEELLFRGAILSGLRHVLPVWAAIVVVGLLFGVFHMFFFKIASTAVTGMVLTYLVIRSGSILTSMTMHFIVNGAAIVLVSEALPHWLEKRLDVGALEQQGVPPGWFIGALAVFAIGIVAMELATRRQRPVKQQESLGSVGPH